MKQHFTMCKTALCAGLLLAFSACSEEEREAYSPTPPEIVQAEIASSACFGDSVVVTVKTANDANIANVTAAVFYESYEASRTKLTRVDVNTYTGLVYAPLIKNVPDGDASVMCLAITDNSSHSEVTQTLHCIHRDYAYLDFIATNGQTYRFDRTGENEYAITGDFPGQLAGYFKSPEPTETEHANGMRVVMWGANGGDIATGSTSAINLLVSDEETVRNVTLKFNTLTFATDVPLLPSTFRLDSDNKSITKDVVKGQTIYFEGLPEDCWVDSDFFTKQDDGSYKLNVESGRYKVTREDSNKYIRVERMNGNDYATYNGTDTNMAIWVIGNGNFGKPSKDNTVNWDTSKGLCMAKVGDNTYQITMKLYYGLGFKFFWQKGWGGEFRRENFASVDSKWFGVKEAGDMEQMDGETILATQLTDDNKWYRVTLDVSGGPNAVKLTCEEIDQP